MVFAFKSGGTWNPGQSVHLIYCDRMRMLQDKHMVGLVISLLLTRFTLP